jgi:hypothetical protein
MASNQPIDHYLRELHAHLTGWHRRPDEVVDETADHLMERTAELQRQGVDPSRASTRAIEEYGTAREIAEAHLRAARRPAIPTDATKAMGVAGMLGGAGWIVVPILAVILPDAQPYWIGLATVFHGTLAASLLACIGLWQRHGGLGPLGYTAVLPAMAAAPFVLFVWPIPAWTVLLGAATLLFGLAILLRAVAPMPAAAAVTCGLALAGGAVLGAEIFVGTHQEDFAFLASRPAGALMVAGMLIFGLGLAGLGRWMRSETPVEVPALPAPSLKH